MTSLKTTTTTRTSLVGVRLGGPNEGDTALIPRWGTKTPHATRHGLKQNRTKTPQLTNA